MHSSTHFVPGNISCLFVICPDSDPSKAGSLGVGFTVNKGVTVQVDYATSTQVFFNGEKISFPTVESVINVILASKKRARQESRKDPGQARMTTDNNNIQVHISSPLPLGSGFGLSGASALATAYALNDLFSLHKTELELAKLAHIAEVENGTGLGDVVNEYYTGFLMKTVPSSQFVAQKIPITGIPVHCKYFSKLPTKAILSNKKRFEQINRAGRKALEEVQNLLRNTVIQTEVEGSHSTSDALDSSTVARNDKEEKELFSQIIQVSKQFAEESGLLTDKQVIHTIQNIESRDGHASMIMLGNAVFSDIPFEDSIELTIC